MFRSRTFLASGILAALGAAASPALAQTGACCLQNGTCSVDTSANCTTALGAYLGNSTTCPATGLCYAEIEANDDLALALANQTTRAVVLTGGDRLVGRTTGTAGTGGSATSPDYWIVQTAVQATPGIWRHQLQLETGFTGTTFAFLGGLQGTTQAGGVANPISGNGATLQAITSLASARPVAWYGFGKQETVILKLTGTTATTGAYNYRLVDAPVTPITATGTILSGPLTIRVINTPDTTYPGTMDAEAWLYDSNFNPLTNGAQGPGGADGLLATGDPADTRTSFTRTLAPGVYYLAVSPTNLANDQPNDAIESSVKNIAAYPDMILCDKMFQNNATTQKYTAAVQLADSSGNVVNSDAALTWVPTWSANVHFVQFTVLPGATGECCIAGACTVTQQADCTGAWTLGGTCSPGPCAAPNGSCCNAIACSITAQANCSGIWTVGGICAPNPCPARCCAPDGTCTLVAQSSCSGTWTSTGTVCDPNPCPQPIGTCCSTSTGACTLLYSGSCPGGTVAGTGTVCDPAACTVISSCCNNISGACTVIYTGSCPTGTSPGSGLTCGPTTCPVIGVCCTNSTGLCALTYGDCGFGKTLGIGLVCEPGACPVISTCCNINAVCTLIYGGSCPGGTSPGNGLVCDASTCPAIGVCCNNTTGECRIIYGGTCQTGYTAGAGTTCEPTTCPAIGACCNNTTGACTVIYGGSCATGATLGTGTVCDASACPPIGTCCDTLTGTCRVIYGGSCPSGTAPGVGTACDPAACPPVGSCCHDTTGECSLNYSTCPAGTTANASLTCGPSPCLPLQSWACCLPDASCRLATQDECAAYAGAWTAGQSCGAFICSPTNLVRNPGAETSDLSNWTITGGAWSATYDSRVHSGRRSFATTSSLGTRTQTIDLVTAGYPATLLDTIPTIIVGDWVASRADQGARYFVQFDLLDASQAVLATWSHGTSAALIQIPANTPYFQETNTFTGYPAGVRFIKITEGGRDVNGWAGFYGAHFDDAFAGVVVYNACCLPDSTCIVQDMASCLNAGGTRQSVTSCTPSPCAAANGACCRGSTCVIETSANCTGANASYKGDGTVCNLPGNNTTPCCRADFNQSGSVTVQDIFDFLGGYFSVNPWADINGSGAVTVQDIFDFLAAYFAGCI